MLLGACDYFITCIIDDCETVITGLAVKRIAITVKACGMYAGARKAASIIEI